MSSRKDRVRRPLVRARDAAAEAFGAVGHVGKNALRTALRLPGIGKRHPRLPAHEPGAPAGLESIQLELARPEDVATITCIDYARDRIESRVVEDLEAFLMQGRAVWVECRWLNVVGLDPRAVAQLHRAYGFHTLAAEDVLHVPQRPRVEPYPGHLFVVARMLTLDEEHIESEQISMFLFGDTLITFQERPGSAWESIQNRLQVQGTRIRENGVDFLMYSLLDALVDHCFPILEHYGQVLEDLEDRIIERPSTEHLRRIQNIKHELAVIRKVMWPTRELVDLLQRGDFSALSDTTRTFLRDVYAHTFQIIDVIESYRDVASGLTEIHMSAISNRMNEIMKVLTIMATIFIPITFLAGVYGMNFRHFPELEWDFGYPAFWGLCALITLALTLYFRRKGWMG